MNDLAVLEAVVLASAPAGKHAQQHEGSVPRASKAWLILILLTLAYAIAMVDRTVLALLIVPLQRDLHLSDTQFGVLQGAAFALFYVMAGLPIGTMIDRLPRIGIITSGLVLWSAATVASAFAAGFATLFAARTVVAVGEASLNPAAYSLLADSFSKERLGRAIGIFSTGAAIGTGTAYLIGGALLSQHQGNADVQVPLLGPLRIWQLAFLIAGMPGILLALFVGRLSEPLRRATQRPADAICTSWWLFFRSHRKALAMVVAIVAPLAILLFYKARSALAAELGGIDDTASKNPRRA